MQFFPRSSVLFMGSGFDLCKAGLVLLVVNMACLTNLSNVAILYVLTC